MKNYLKLHLCIVLVFFITVCSNSSLFSQSTFATSAASVTDNGGSVSYTIGQIAYSSIEQTEGTVLQGVQQPYEVFVITSAVESNTINLVCSVFPNPTSHKLILEVKDFNSEDLMYELYDVSGKQLLHDQIFSNQTTIDLQELAPTSYFLRVISHSEIIKVFKIVKN
jgi:hypothetical protein